MRTARGNDDDYWNQVENVDAFRDATMDFIKCIADGDFASVISMPPFLKLTKNALDAAVELPPAFHEFYKAHLKPAGSKRPKRGTDPVLLSSGDDETGSDEEPPVSEPDPAPSVAEPGVPVGKMPRGKIL